MGDWRKMGSAARRRMGAPSHHSGGAAPDPRAGISGMNGEQTQALAAMEAARTEQRCEDCGGYH